MTRWIRVTKANPCAICQKPDWCCYSDSRILCMRIESPQPGRSGGWFHPLDGKAQRLPPKRIVQAAPAVNCEKLWREWCNQTKHEELLQLAEELGVSDKSLRCLGFVWAAQYGCWAVPMRDGYGNMIGLHRRYATGEKKVVGGTKAGLFMPFITDSRGLLAITEGASDCAAALTLGYDSVGRFNCATGADHLRPLIKRLGFQRAMLIADNNRPGVSGAAKLANKIGIPTCIWIPPAKDLRTFLQAGGTRELVEALTKTLVWNKP